MVPAWCRSWNRDNTILWLNGSSLWKFFADDWWKPVPSMYFISGCYIVIILKSLKLFNTGNWCSNVMCSCVVVNKRLTFQTWQKSQTIQDEEMYRKAKQAYKKIIATAEANQGSLHQALVVELTRPCLLLFSSTCWQIYWWCAVFRHNPVHVHIGQNRILCGHQQILNRPYSKQGLFHCDPPIVS